MQFTRRTAEDYIRCILRPDFPIRANSNGLCDNAKIFTAATQNLISQHFALQTTASTESAISHQERMRKLKETQKRVEEEKRRIAEQVQHTASRFTCMLHTD